MKARGMLYDGRPYIEYTTVRDYVNERFYWDANENILLYTLPTDVVSVGVGSSEYTVGTTVNAEEYVILKTEGPVPYILPLTLYKSIRILIMKYFKIPIVLSLQQEMEK